MKDGQRVTHMHSPDRAGTITATQTVGGLDGPVDMARIEWDGGGRGWNAIDTLRIVETRRLATPCGFCGTWDVHTDACRTFRGML